MTSGWILRHVDLTPRQFQGLEVMRIERRYQERYCSWSPAKNVIKPAPPIVPLADPLMPTYASRFVRMYEGLIFGWLYYAW